MNELEKLPVCSATFAPDCLYGNEHANATVRRSHHSISWII